VSIRLTGRAAAPGAAFAPAFVVDSQPPLDTDLPAARSGSVDKETARLRAALNRAEEELEELARTVEASTGVDEAGIFEAQAEFAADPEVGALAEDAIRAGASAERAVVEAFGTFRELLSASSDEYLAGRVADLDDVRDRVVKVLLGRSTSGRAPKVRSVIVAHELTPSQTASIPFPVIAGIVTETGSPTSHAAILARALGTPAVVSCPGLLDAVRDGEHQLGVDGRTGAVIVDPGSSERDAIERRMGEEDRRRDELLALRDDPGHTADGHRVELAANIAAIQHLPAAVEAGGAGSGLVRTEFLFLDRTTAPSVDDQVTFYAEVLRAFPGHRVVFRTLDVGADKPLPFVERESEDNPALGLRGIRLSLQRPDLFRAQLRALLRAGAEVSGEGAGRLAIMFPLVSTVLELLQARAILDDVAEEERTDLSSIEVGVMIEVPSAALDAHEFAAHADFLSIGTNDLLQYLFAADRLNGAVADLGNVLEPTVLALIRQVIDAGHANGAWVGVCGEAAGDPMVAVALVGLGVDELSMTRVAIPEVKDALRRVTLDECRQAVEAAIAGGHDGPGTRKILEGRLGTGLAKHD
jgi:phosphoenolpyruvate-protein phosphotransferase (PTS system enzyme I)